MKYATIIGLVLAAPSFLFAQYFSYTPLLTTGEQNGATWKYTTAQPAADWFQPFFDDAAWPSGQSGFGTGGTPGITVRTTWDTPDIWLRRSFSLGSIDTALGELALRLIYDEDPTVYINGVEALSLSGAQYATSYQTRAIPAEARNAIISNGTNAIAVHAHQSAGGQGIDVGLGQGWGKITSEKMPLWPDRAAPGALGTAAADSPYVVVYRPPESVPVAGTMLFVPGGGYGGVVTNEPQWARDYFLPKGWIIAVLQYRVAPYKHPIPILDVKRAMRLVKSQAESWHADSGKVIVMGCSAGGHLSSTLATHFDGGDPSAEDPIDRIGCKPYLSVLVYPVITMDASFTHAGSRTNLLGDNPPQELVDSLSNEKQVSANSPPAFLVHGTVDVIVPVKNSQVYYDSCRAHNVDAEYYEITDGCGYHGFSYACGDNWIDTCHAWLRSHLDVTATAGERIGAGQLRNVRSGGDAEGQTFLFDISGRTVPIGKEYNGTSYRGLYRSKSLPTGVYLLVRRTKGATAHVVRRIVIGR
jgi:acetyl esterase/lipase